MNSGNISEEEMKYLIDKYSGENIDKVMATSLLSHPFAASGPRQHLFSVHYSQHVMINNGETPRSFTGYEKIFGKYLSSYEKATRNWEIVAKISRHSSFPDMIYTLVLREPRTHNYDIVKVSHYEKLSDQHGYMRPFTFVDKKGVGATINRDDIIFKADSLDSFGNYRYGKNLKIAYLFLHGVKEDAIIVSDECAEKVTFDLVSKTERDIQKNDVLLNLYGNSGDYKCFPAVGEDVNDMGILFATRRMEKKNISADFTNQALSHLYYSDNKYGAHGTVVDIDIKVNDVEELKKDPHRDQLYNAYMDQLRYNQELVNVLGPIVSNNRNHVTDRLIQCLYTARSYVDPNIKYSSNTGNFEFAHITIYTVDRQSLTTAMKLTNRCGGKAVISGIWPKEFMPIDQNGVRADMICCSNGIVGRTNPDQLEEQLLNYISDEVLRRAMKMRSIDDSIKYIFDYFKMVSPEWGEYIERYYKTRSKKEKEESYRKMCETGLYTYNPPAYNSVDWDKLKKAIQKYKISVGKIKMCRTYKVSKEVADMYDTKDTIENVKSFMESFVFDAKTNVLKKTNEKGKTVKETVKENTEFTVFDFFNKNNPLHLSKEEYEENKWTDNYIWSDNSVGVDDLFDERQDADLSNFIGTVQELEGVWNREDFGETQIQSAFDTSKSRVYRVDETTLVREFTSKYPVIIADVYMMLLRQMPDAMFSARALGTVTPLGIPNKSTKRSEIGKPFGDTPNQISDMENTDLKNLVDPLKVNRFFAVQSTNPSLESELARVLMFDDPATLHDLPIADEDITDTVPARQFGQYLASIGLELGDMDDDDPYEFLDGVNYTSVQDLMKKVGITQEASPFAKNKNKEK